MVKNDVIIGTTSCEIVPINRIELAARLGNGISVDSDIIKQHIDIFNEKVTYRYAYTTVQCKCINDLCYLDETVVASSALSKVLKNSTEAILLAVTAGFDIDKLISKATLQNALAGFYVDAIASACIESYIEFISNDICKGLNVTNRFSPGYADFPLDYQIHLLDRLSAKESIGIVLSNDYLMIPTKSITAVIGLK